MLPVLVRGFNEKKGVVVFKLDIKFIPKETSETIGKELLETGTTCPTNFGGVTRRGENNVFARLKGKFGREILGIGCVAHIVHNAFDSSCDQLPIDIEALVVNVYKHFHIHTLRVEALR